MAPFVRVVAAPKERCYCKKPSSNDGKYFGVGTIWACDVCGSAWEFTGTKSDQREGTWDEWKRNTDHDGPDNRPRPDPPKVEPYRNSLAEQRDGARNRSTGCFS